MYCTKCGTKISENVSYCSNCGNKINGDTEKKPRSGMKFIIVLGVLCLLVCVGICILAKGKDTSNTDKILGCLTEQEEITEYSISTYLPVEGQYERVIKEDNNFTPYSITNYYYDEYGTLCYLNNLYGKNGYVEYSEFSTEGFLDCDDETGIIVNKYFDYFENTQESIYLIPPGKRYEDIQIEPNYYTVETSTGTYTDCIVKTQGESGKDYVVTAYAPYIGEILEVTLTPEREVAIWTETRPYTDNNASTSIGGVEEETDISLDMPDEGMIISDLMDNENAEYWTGNDSLILTIQFEEEYYHLYMIDTETYQTPYSGIIFDNSTDVVSVMGDAGCREATLEYISNNELELRVGEDIYTFFK